MPIRSAFAILVALAASLQAEPVNPKIIERYKQMLEAKPEEGIAMDRLWKAALESGGSDAMIAEYKARNTFAGRMVLGHLLRRAGRDEEAATAFREAAKLDPQSALPSLALAKLESGRGRPREAAAWLEKALAALPEGDARRADTLIELGAAWLAAGDAAKAAEAWERSVALAPKDLELRRRLAAAYARHHLSEPAIRHLEFLVENAAPAERATALQEIARLHSAGGRPGKAIEALERAVSFTAPGNWLRSELLGQIIRHAQRQHAEAELEAKWKTQAEQNPRDLGAGMQLLEFYERTGNVEQQIAWLEKLSALVPRNPDLRLKLARALVQADRLDAAMARYDQLLAEPPGNSELVFERAKLDLQKEDPSAVRARISALLQRNPSDESLRAKALAFYQEHRLFDLVEEHLKADAANGSEEPLFALATFYFSQGRKEQARETLQRLIRSDDPAEKRVALHHRMAEALKAQNELGAAVQAVEAALALQPNHRELHLLRGDLCAARREYDSARDSFARAFALAKDEAGQLEADSKLFETFRAESPTTEEESDPARPKVTMAARVSGFIWELMRAAKEQKDAASWLRVARWKAWNSDRSSAVTFAVKAAELEPKNLAPREFLAKLASAHGEVAMALLYLRELAELNPAGRAGYLREIAQLELQRGQTKEALGTFKELATANPGSSEALADLAAAQERAGQLKDALTSWRKVVELTPAHRKREAGVSVLRVLQQLGQHEEAAQWLLRGVDDTPDEQEKTRRFDELLLHAKQHDLLPWLRTEFEERRKVRADDYFTAVALGRVLKLLGDKVGAFELFADAVYAGPNPGEALPELIREAEELRRLDVAVRLQEQLTRVTRQNQPDDLLKLAALYQKTGDLEGTERAWVRAVAKFPRDVEVIRRAAEFHGLWGDPARLPALLRKLTVLEPSDVRAALELGEVEFQAGRMGEARSAFEVVMRLTKPVAHRLYPAKARGSPWGEKGIFVGTSRVARSGVDGVFLAAPWRSVPTNLSLPPNAEAELRLKALARLAEIAAREGGGAADRWRAEWLPSLETQTTEAIWALYFAGAQDAALGEVSRRIEKEAHVEGHRQAFIWMALESGAHDRLREWLNRVGRGAKDMEWFGVALGQWLGANPERLDRAVLDRLFPNGESARVWPSALELARHGRFPEALGLGERAWQNMPTRHAEMAREMARWHLALGQLTEAQQVLRSVMEDGSDSLEGPAFASFWELYHLLDGQTRTRLVEEKLKGAPGETHHALMWRLVCHALAGNKEEARKALDTLIAKRPLGPPALEDSNSAVRTLGFVSGVSRQLLEWDQPDLAARVWKRAFSDQGLLAWWRAQKVQEQVKGAKETSQLWTYRPIVVDEELQRARVQADVLEFLRGGAAERGRIVAEKKGAEALEELGEALETKGALADASAVFELRWESERSNTALLRKALDAARQAGDTRRSESLRRHYLEDRTIPASDGGRRELALELADLLEQRGALEEALQVLSRAGREDDDLRVMLRKADLLERLGREAEAKKTWELLEKMESGNAYARNALGLRLEQKGRFAEALAARTSGGTGADAQVPVLLYKLGRSDDAVTALEKLAGSQAIYAAMTLAELMGMRGEGNLARSVLMATAARVQDARAQMQLQAKLLTIPGFPPPTEMAQRTRTRLRALVAQNRELVEPYVDFFEERAERFGMKQEWNAEMAEMWANGSVAAGVVVMQRQLTAGDRAAARETADKILGRVDLGADVIGRMERHAVTAKDDMLRIAIATERAKRGWPNAQATFDLIRLLDATGGRESARMVLADYEWLIAYPGGAELLGRARLELGDAERARGFYERAMKDNPLVPSASELAGMARVQVAAKRLEAARILLRRAFAVPACREYAALIEYLEARKEVGRWKEVAREFDLSPTGEFELTIALFRHFEKAGRMTDALALVAEAPQIVVPSEKRAEDHEGISAGELRALARKTGRFAETGKVFDLLIATGLPEAAAQRAGLEADRAEVAAEPATAHLARAAELAPRNWEFARRLAEAQLSAGEGGKARQTVERFLAVAVVSRERPAALELWEKARH